MQVKEGNWQVRGFYEKRYFESLAISYKLAPFSPEKYQSQAAAWLFQLSGFSFGTNMQVNQRIMQEEWLIRQVNKCIMQVEEDNWQVRGFYKKRYLIKLPIFYNLAPF